MAVAILPEVELDRRIWLTKRELDVLFLIIEGKSSRAVASALYVVKKTVDFHLANIYDKLNVHNRVQLYWRAMRLGFIPIKTLLAEQEPEAKAA